MSFIKFLFTKTFLKHLLLAAGLIVALCFLYLFWLSYYTNHGQKIEVPNLAKLSLVEVDEKLEELDLRRKLIDSSSYNPEFPPRSVIEQDPAAGKFVKENRQIYIKLNPSGYGEIQIPNLINRTRRQAEPTLKALGFKIGEVTYRPHIATDMVLELRHNGEKVEAGNSLMKTSVIDLVLGDKSLLYTQEPAAQDTPEDATGN
ncbi:MAG: PASTA domain-containing protein [Nonlabens sp.]|uniref:PASTA domain-containing protein n=1 Tax=Nonlabens sp. TaxID=1888209 RepID=UPI003EF9A572